MTKVTVVTFFDFHTFVYRTLALLVHPVTEVYLTGFKEHSLFPICLLLVQSEKLKYASQLIFSLNLNDSTIKTIANLSFTRNLEIAMYYMEILYSFL